jgi:hypothetical protein
LILDRTPGAEYVNYVVLARVLVEAVREQQANLDSLMKVVSEQQTELPSLKTEVQQLKALLMAR